MFPRFFFVGFLRSVVGYMAAKLAVLLEAYVLLASLRKGDVANVIYSSNA